MSFLEKLRELSVERCERYFFPLNAWNVLEWAGAAAGEAGETANVAKKIRRLETYAIYDLYGEINKDKRDKLMAQLGDEVADTIIYLDLLCASQGIDLEDAVRRKFNQVSDKYGFKKTLW